jgi:aminoglycoside phosphotransferase (APT) family kinase protein
MIPPLTRLLQARWPELRPGSPPVATAMVAGVDRSPAAKATLVFFDQAGDLAAVAKVGRSAASEPALVREYETISHLWALGVPSVRDRVAEPLLLERVAGRLALVQAPLRGRPMTADYYTPGHVADRAAVAEDFARAAAWLLAFQRETDTGPGVLDSSLLDRWVGQVIRSYRGEVGWGATEEKLFADVQTRAEALTGLPLPTAAVHGDYWMGNLLVDASCLRGVIDWERGRASGPCPLDVYKFPTSYAVYMDRAYPGGIVPGHEGRERWRERWRRFGDWPNLAGFGYAYWGEGWFPELVRGFVGGHLDALGMPAEANAVFFPLFLAEQALLPGHPRTRAAHRAMVQALAEEPEPTWLRS